LYSVDEIPPHWLTLVLSFQHVLLMFNGIIIVPAIIATAFDVGPEQIAYLIFATIIVTSITTWIQAVRLGRIGSGYVLFMGVSGTFFACTLDAMAVGGLALVATMCLLAAPVEFLFSYFLRHLRNIITPSVGGVVVMLVTVMVVPIGLEMWTGPKGKPGFGSMENLIVGVFTFSTIMGIAVFGGTNIRLWAPILGTAIGYGAGGFWGLVDYSHLASAPWIGLPQASWPGFQFHLTTEAIPILITFGFATLVGTIESVGDAMAVQRISERNFKKIDYDRVQGCLYADGVGNCLAGLTGTIPNTTYSGNIAILELTGVASRRIGIYGAGILMVLAFCPKVSALIVSIPGPVLGASLVFLMGMLFATGVQLAVSAGVNYQIGVVVGVSFCVGLMMQSGQFFPDILPRAFEPVMTNGLVMGGLTAVVLNTAFHALPGRRATLRLKPDPAQVSALNNFIEEQASSLGLSLSQANALQLACEEVFMHISGGEDEASDTNTVQVQLLSREDHVQVDFEDRSQVRDVDDTIVMPKPEVATEAELDQLGLFLLNKVAKEVTHIRISGYNCISFKIY
jgi:NCS2 family nucleobase:cation symporter-2/xanthine permease XanP